VRHTGVSPALVSEATEVVLSSPTATKDCDALKMFLDVDVLQTAADPLFNTSEATRILEALSKEKSSYAPSIAYLMAIKSQTPSDALALLERALTLGASNQAHIFFLKGINFLKLEQYEKAWEQFERIRVEFPDSAAAWQIKLRKLDFTRERAIEKDKESKGGMVIPTRQKNSTTPPITHELLFAEVALGIIGLALAGYLIVLLSRRRHKHKSV
jgi:tetratricopeptide (TPR) repeat protein